MHNHRHKGLPVRKLSRFGCDMPFNNRTWVTFSSWWEHKPPAEECYLQRERGVGGGGAGRKEEGTKKERDWWSHLNYKYVPGIQNRNTGLLPGTKVGFGSRPRSTSAAAPALKPDCFVIQITAERSNSIGYEHRSLDPVPERVGNYMQICALSIHSVHAFTHMRLCKRRQMQNAPESDMEPIYNAQNPI